MDAFANNPLLWIVPISGLVAVAVAAYFAYDVLGSDTGTPAMQEVAGAIYEGARSPSSTASTAPSRSSLSAAPSSSRSSSISSRPLPA